MGCQQSSLASYTSPSELFPRATTHLTVRGFAANGGPSKLPIVGVASASVVGELPSSSAAKENQDAFAGDAMLCDNPHLGLFSVLDGHGPFGHQIARTLARQLAGHVAAEQPNALHGGRDGVPARGVAPELALRRAFLRQHVALLKAGEEMDCSLSGATCATLLLDGLSHRAITANVGEARCVAGLQRAPRERIRAEEWTCDHTPELAEEARRVLAMQGRIAPWSEDYRSRRPVQRVWLADSDTPGLAVTRSFGDTVGARVGVLAEPTIRSWPCVHLRHAHLKSASPALTITCGLHWCSQSHSGDALHCSRDGRLMASCVLARGGRAGCAGTRLARYGARCRIFARRPSVGSMG